MNKPSCGISIIKEYDQSTFFHLSCDCLSPEHTWVLEMDYDDTYGDMTLNIWAECCIHSMYNDNWFIRQWNKITGIWKIIFNIPFIYTSDLGITDERHINSFIEALEYGRERIHNHKRNKATNDNDTD